MVQGCQAGLDEAGPVRLVTVQQAGAVVVVLAALAWAVRWFLTGRID